MATTPTYSWPTPDNTDLVKDGALAMRNLGDAIDTTVGDIDQATTKGDLLVYDGTDYQRLPVGSDNQLLQADSGQATGLAWATFSANSFTLLASGSLTGSGLSITGISGGSYQKLVLLLENISVTSGSAAQFLRVNSLTSNYDRLTGNTGSASWSASSTANSFFDVSVTTATTSSVYATFHNPSVTTGSRLFVQCFGFSANANDTLFSLAGLDSNTVTSIETAFNVAATYATGTYELYGVN